MTSTSNDSRPTTSKRRSAWGAHILENGAKEQKEPPQGNPVPAWNRSLAGDGQEEEKIREQLAQDQKVAAERAARAAEMRVAYQTALGDRCFAFEKGGAVMHLGPQDILSPLKDHPVFREAIEANPPFIRVMETLSEGGHRITKMHTIRRELFNKSLPEIFSRNLHLEGAETFGRRISRMSPGERGMAAGNALLAGVFLFEAVQNFRHAREADPITGERKTNWSNLTWGTVNAALAALSTVSLTSYLKGGSGR